MAAQAGAQLEEARALDHALLLEDVGDLREARTLRDRHPDRLAPAVALERLEERVGEPGDAEDDGDEHAERDQAAPVPAVARLSPAVESCRRL